MSALFACPSCSVHLKTSEATCPHCGARIGVGPDRLLARTAAAVLMGLALAGCPAGEKNGSTTAAYGVPDTSDPTTEAGTSTEATGEDSGTTGTESSGDGTSSLSGTDANTDTSSGSGSSSTSSG